MLSKSKALFATFGLAVLAAPWLGAQPAQGNTTIRHGVGMGHWDLPLSSSGQGTVDGIFWIPNVPNSSMQFAATLTDVPGPCLSCIGGTLQGTLDDGIGPGPDYIVDGEYFGSFFGGNGSWSARIYAANPPGTTPVGRIRGKFDDPPSNAGPGSFVCRWVIND